jgi:hypothetical protein
MDKKKIWFILVLFWVVVIGISVSVIRHYGLLEKPLSGIGIEVEQ